MGIFTPAELKLHIKRARSETRSAIFNLDADGPHILPVAAPQTLLHALVRTDANSHGGSPSNRLHSSLFFNVLKDSGIQLRIEETEALAIAFGDWQADIDYQKWWRSLGVTPPGDYTDPELLFDQLPQPYRTVTKVLEQDILDASWNVLTDRHPELLLVQPENHTGPLLELENIVMPPVATTTAGAVTAVQTVGASSGGGSSDYNSPFASFVLTGSSSGRVAVLDATGAVVSSLVVGEVLATAGVAGIDAALLGGKGSGITALSAASDDPTHPLRFAAVLADLTAERPGTSGRTDESIDGGSKGKGNKGDEPQGTATVSSTLVLFELWPVLQAKDESEGPAMLGAGAGAGAGGPGEGGDGVNSGAGDGGLEGVEVARPRLVFVSASTINEPTALLEITLASDGLFLSAAFADGALKILALPPRPVLPTVSGDDEAGKMEKIPEEVEANDGDAAALFGGTGMITPFYPPVVALPSPPPAPTYADQLGGEGTEAQPAQQFWPRGLVGRCVFLQAASRGAGLSDVGPERDRLATTTVAVWREGSNVLRKYQLPAPAAIVAIVSAANAAAEAAAAADGNAPEELDAATEAAATAAAEQVSLLGEFTFGGAITALAISPANSRGLGQTTQLLGVAAIGTEIGSVFLWDLNLGVLRAVLGAHHAAISSLTFHQGSMLFTGSTDGVLQAYELFPPALTAAQQAQQAQSAKELKNSQETSRKGGKEAAVASPTGLPAQFDDGSGFLPPRLLKVVWHIKERIVWMASTSAAPLLFVQGASGTVIVYDLKDVTLIGALGANIDAGLAPVVQEAALALANDLGLDAVAQGKLRGLPRDAVSFDCDPKLLVSCSATSVVIISSTPALRAFGNDVNGNGDDAMSMTSQSAASLPGADDNASAASVVISIPSASVGIYPCWTIAEQLCPGIAAFIGSSYNSPSAVLETFAQLSPEQRRDKDLDVEQLRVASLGLTASARTHHGGGGSRSVMRSGGLGASLQDSRHGGGLESRGSRQTSSRSSRDSRGSRTPSAGGGASARGSFVAELTAENLGDLETAAERAESSMGFSQRYLPTSAYVLREMQQRHSGRPERDARLMNRRQELMEYLTSV